MAIWERIVEWNPWWEARDFSELTGMERELLQEVMKWSEEKEVKVILGPRRAGKVPLYIK